MTEPQTAVPGRGARKSLKEQNRWQLWLIVAANALFLYAVVQANAIRLEGIRAAFTDAANLVPIAFAVLIATVLNGLLSADAKARLVFLRWNHALPGHRAFSKYASSDPRVDVRALAKIHGAPLPVDPPEQNRVWYRMYKTVENEPAVRQVHSDFLLLRDYTGIAVLFVIFLGPAALYAVPSYKVALIYLGVLMLQYAVVRQAASNYGIRFVTTVLALKAAKQPEKKPRAAPKTKKKEGPSKGSVTAKF